MKTKTITYLLLLGTFFYACSKCEETTGSTRKVSPLDITLLFPYDNIKTVKFLKNKSDTVIFHNSGLQTTYNYTSTQSDCPEKIPLEEKYLQFIDSINGNEFLLMLYINSAFYSNFAISINNKIYANGNSLGFTKTSNPPISSIILGKRYDTITSVINVFNDSLTFKKKNYGLLKFTTNGNTFELIP